MKAWKAGILPLRILAETPKYVGRLQGGLGSRWADKADCRGKNSVIGLRKR